MHKQMKKSDIMMNEEKHTLSLGDSVAPPLLTVVM